MFQRIRVVTGIYNKGFLPKQNVISSIRSLSVTGIRMNDQKNDSVRDQLYEAVKSNGNNISTSSTTNKPSLDDSLFDVLNNLDSNTQSSDKAFQDDLGLSSATQIHPRDIAKNIRMSGPLAGRTVDVNSGAVSYGVNSINTILRTNKIRYLQRVQSRYIPPAKYRKQLKREWWRRRFLQGFKGLMAQVNDAKRRGY